MSVDDKWVDGVSICDQCGELREATGRGNDYVKRQRGPVALVRGSAEAHAIRRRHRVTMIRTETVVWDKRGTS